MVVFYVLPGPGKLLFSGDGSNLVLVPAPSERPTPISCGERKLFLESNQSLNYRQLYIQYSAGVFIRIFLPVLSDSVIDSGILIIIDCVWLCLLLNVK